MTTDSCLLLNLYLICGLLWGADELTWRRKADPAWPLLMQVLVFLLCAPFWPVFILIGVWKGRL